MPSPAIRVIAEACPYAFFIANGAKALPRNEAIQYLNLGFMCVLIKLNDDSMVPLAHMIIKDIEKFEHAANVENRREIGFNSMSLYLKLGLDPFYGYKKDHDLYTAVKKSNMAHENKDRLIAMFDNAFSKWPEEMKAEGSKYMFRRGSRFNYGEKGLPFVLKNHDDYLSYFS